MVAKALILVSMQLLNLKDIVDTTLITHPVMLTPPILKEDRLAEEELTKEVKGNESLM